MKLRIFIIDDEECIRDSYMWHLESLGHEVITAAQPEMCNIYRDYHCESDVACGDILIIDYNLPIMTGLEYIEQLHAHGCKGAIKQVMLLSGSLTEIDMERAKALGCEIRQKPLRLAELEEWVDECAKTIDPDRKLIDLDVLKSRMGSV